jgi:hypothetical protein
MFQLWSGNNSKQSNSRPKFKQIDCISGNPGFAVKIRSPLSQRVEIVSKSAPEQPADRKTLLGSIGCSGVPNFSAIATLAAYEPVYYV